MNIVEANQHQLPIITGAGALVLIVAIAAVTGVTGSNIIDDINSFRICLGLLLSIACAAQLTTTITLYRHRSNLMLELFQPVGLALLTAAGAIATLSFYLHFQNVPCVVPFDSRLS
jgi:hypothetical protein